MHEVNILPSLRLGWILLTHQLIYKSKFEKHKASLDIFELGISRAKNLHLLGLEGKHFSYIMAHNRWTFYWILFWCLGICTAQNQSFIIEVKKHSY